MTYQPYPHREATDSASSNVLQEVSALARPMNVPPPMLRQGGVSHVTRHTSHVTRHTSYVTRHSSHVIRHTSHVTRHTSHVTRHLLPLTLENWPSSSTFRTETPLPTLTTRQGKSIAYQRKANASESSSSSSSSSWEAARAATLWHTWLKPKP